MSNTDPRRGAGIAAVLMLLSFVSMLGLMYWLSQNAEPTAALIPEETMEDPDDRIQIVSLADFAANPTGYMTEEFQLNGIEVVGRLGNHAFWIPLPAGQNTMPYLVHMDSTVYANLRVTAGETVSITGIVLSMTPETLDAWEAAGAWENDTNRIEAEFATDYIEASAVEVAGSAGGTPEGQGN
jgi:hypothetical protein